MDGADDVTQIDVPNVAAAMETCCSLCSNREDEEIGNCQAWDTFPAGDNAWLCQVGRSGWGQMRRWGEAPGFQGKHWLALVTARRFWRRASLPT